MDADHIRRMMKDDKFTAFDVRNASGNSYRVRSPEMGWLSPEDDVMLVYDPEQGVSLIDVDHVVECVRPIRPKPKGKADRRGMTVIEVVVIIAILAGVVALLLPAVLAMREAARRAKCLGNLRQIGVALHQYESTWRTFPPLGTIADGGTSGSYSVQAQILPSMSLGGMFDAFDVRVGAAMNATVTSAVVSSYLCPNEVHDGTPRAGGVGGAPTSYAANAGTWLIWDPGSKKGGDGAFVVDRAIAMTEVLDGTANTLALAEVKPTWAVLHGGDTPPAPGLGPPENARQVVAWGGSITPSISHTHWADGSVIQSAMTTLLPPNTPVLVDSGTGDRPIDVNFASGLLDRSVSRPSQAAITSRSYHPGGVNVVLLDGSSRFIKNSVRPDIWHRVGTRDEPISDHGSY